MLINDRNIIGDKLLNFRKKKGLTQAEVAEKAGLADRTYADIERGTTNMRVDTLLRICTVLDITPNDLLVDGAPTLSVRQDELFSKLADCTASQHETALGLLALYLNSLD